ncbi:MAG TPA: thioredoxin-dependent thiol peroxidase [Pyrinomonadaceae bacterium]|jgi:peroxiredoxin Q/BCP
MLKEGDNAPDFSVKNQNGEDVKLSDLRGQKVALYFYPKDDTPGCTKEACSLRDNFSNLTGAGIKVFGVSMDSEKSHQKFISKYELPFDLLVDADHSIADSYNSYGEKKFMGKTYNGILRKTFLIDEDGKIKKIFDKVNVDAHADEVLQAFES